MAGNVPGYVRVVHWAVAGELGVAAGVRWSSRPSVGYVRRPWSIGSPSAEPPVTTSHLADGAVVDGLRRGLLHAGWPETSVNLERLFLRLFHVR